LQRLGVIRQVRDAERDYFIHYRRSVRGRWGGFCVSCENTGVVQALTKPIAHTRDATVAIVGFITALLKGTVYDLREP
jgi:hypothetical protein